MEELFLLLSTAETLIHNVTERSWRAHFGASFETTAIIWDILKRVKFERPLKPKPFVTGFGLSSRLWLLSYHLICFRTGITGIVDTTECPIQQPSGVKTQRNFYSSKKKKHTLKYELVLDLSTELITWLLLGNKAYQGESCFLTPFKGHVTGTLLEFNQVHGGECVDIERAIGHLKSFSCLTIPWQHSLDNHSACFLTVERLRLGTLNGNRSWKLALQAVQKEAKIPECFVKGDKLNQFLEEAFKLAVEKYGHLNTTTVKFPPSQRANQKEEDDRGAEDQCNLRKIDSDSVSADDAKVRTNSQVALLFDCISSVSREDLIESLDQEINNLMTEEKGSAQGTKGGPAPGAHYQQSYAEVVRSAPRSDQITVERNFPPTVTTASALSLEYWKEEMAKDQEICWQDNSNIYRRTWTKDTVTDPNYWSKVKPKYGFASPYSKVGAVEGRSIVVSSKDLKKEKVCERIFELGLKHVGVWKVGENRRSQE
ncbi:IS5 family transposase [Balamuthia mandrillaris]